MWRQTDGEGQVSLQRVRATQITCGKDTNKQKMNEVKKKKSVLTRVVEISEDVS